MPAWSRRIGRFLAHGVWDTEVTGLDGEDKLKSLSLRNLKTGAESTLDVTGLFIAIGHDPRSELLTGQVDLDDDGYVLVRQPTTATNLAGVFAAGDLVDHTYRQAITAAGSGCMAALDSEWYLRDNPAVPTPAALEGTGDLAEEQWLPSSTTAGSTISRSAPTWPISPAAS